MKPSKGWITGFGSHSIALALLAVGVAVGAGSAQVSPIDPGKPIERSIQGGESHAYTIRIESDQYLWLTAEPRNLRLSVALQGPDARTLVDTEAISAKSLSEVFWVAAAPGEYRIVVRAVGNQAAGSYNLQLRSLRPPSPEDRARANAFGVTAEATELLESRTTTADSMQIAVRKYQEAIGLWESAGDAQWKAFAEHQLGGAYLTLQKLPLARDLLLSALPNRRATGDPRLIALTLSTLAAVYNDLGEYRQALRVAEEALPLRRAAGDRRGEANTLNNLAFTHVRLNERARAIDLHLDALAIRREIGDQQGATLALGNLATLYRYMGFAEKALEMSVEQLSIARALGDARREADALGGLGESYYMLGEIKKAQDYWLQAQPAYQKAGDAFGVAMSLSSLGAASANLKNYKAAAEYYAQSLELRRAASNKSGEISSSLGLCFVLSSTGDVARASEYGEQALGIARKIDSKQGIGRSQRCLAELDQKAGRWSQARDRLVESADIFRANGSTVDLSLTLAALATLEAHGENLKQALAVAKQAQELVEWERVGLTADLRASLRASRSEVYALEVDVLMRMHAAAPSGGFAARALEAQERSRARSLIEAVTDSRFDLRRELTPEQSTREAAIQNRIGVIQKQLLGDTSANPAATREKKRQLAAAEREVELLQVEFRQATVDRFAEGQYAAALSPDRIRRQLLGDGATLIEYALGEKRSYVWALTASGLISATLPPREEIEKQVAAYRQQMSQPVSSLTISSSPSRIDSLSRRLYNVLVKPIEKSMAASQRLIVVPDGALAYLPFETLTAARPLIERFAISYAPSASALAGLRERAVGAPQRLMSLMAFADPVYAAAGSAGVPEGRGLAFTRLPNTRTEVTSIGSLFQPADRKIYLGKDATERQMKAQDISSVRFLHLAAHGYVDEDQPAHSGIVLSQATESGEDGVLRVPEIMRLRLRADMVTLSACQTALGRVVGGEGVMGLSRAFLFAGAQSVVVSLWNVNDSATAELMSAFYRNLKNGSSRDEALRQAKLSLLKGSQKLWRHPFYWAPFIFVGDTAMAERK
ncbi:MAG: CHAT domain-containing tetratricopeptide repeat protein [Bryobacteraceae bacterium]